MSEPRSKALFGRGFFEPIVDKNIPDLQAHLRKAWKTGMLAGGMTIALAGIGFWSILPASSPLFWPVTLACLCTSVVLNILVRTLDDKVSHLIHEPHIATLIVYLTFIVGAAGPITSPYAPLLFLIPFGVLIFAPNKPTFFARLGIYIMAMDIVWHYAAARFSFEEFASRQIAGVVSTLCCMLAAQFARRSWWRDHQTQLRLRAADRLRNLGQHAAGIAHELKTPLAAALIEGHGMKALLDELIASVGHEGVTDEDLREIAEEMSQHLDILVPSLEKATRFVQGVQQHTRGLSSGKKTTFALRDCVEGVSALLNHRLRGSRVTLDLSTIDDSLMLVGDQARLEQVLVNLVTNAFEAIEESGTGSTVKIEAEEISSGVRLAVIDDGPGVATSLRDRIFEPLFTSREEGTGLGLSVCRDIVHGVFGGTLTLVPTDKGARFELGLPVTPSLTEPFASTDTPWVPYTPRDISGDEESPLV